MNKNNKYHKLHNYLHSLKKVLVAFSGGCDSTFLLFSAVKALGADKVCAVTAVSETYTPSELKLSKRTAKKLNVKQIIIKTNELKNKNFSKNPYMRCFYCKDELFSKLNHIAKKNNMIVVDGSNASDINDFRPGKKAAAKWRVKHPLLTVGFLKKDIRAFSKKFNLPTWNHPAGACLASRIPFGNPITLRKLKTIYKAEEILKNIGFKVVRVRMHDNLARIEVGEKEIKKMVSSKIRNKINFLFARLGYKFITVDLRGYKTGSFNPKEKLKTGNYYLTIERE